MARTHDAGTAELVQQIGRLKRLITELESEAIQHRSRAERQRAADMAIAQDLHSKWSTTMPDYADDRLGRERARGRVEAAHLIATEIREREVVQ